MKLEDLVLTIEQAKYLQKLGLDMSDAALCWFQSIIDEKWSITSITDGIRNVLKGYEQPYVTTNVIPTYTLQEVLNKLPENNIAIHYPNFKDDVYEISYIFDENKKIFLGETLLETAYNMLCWVILNGYLKTN